MKVSAIYSLLCAPVQSSAWKRCGINAMGNPCRPVPCRVQVFFTFRSAPFCHPFATHKWIVFGVKLLKIESFTSSNDRCVLVVLAVGFYSRTHEFKLKNAPKTMDLQIIKTGFRGTLTCSFKPNNILNIYRTQIKRKKCIGVTARVQDPSGGDASQRYV